jgi:hypothetical protein
VQNVQNLADHPKEAMNEITTIKKKAERMLHYLVEDMLKLDSLSVEGIRPARKKEVCSPFVVFFLFLLFCCCFCFCFVFVFSFCLKKFASISDYEHPTYHRQY